MIGNTILLTPMHFNKELKPSIIMYLCHLDVTKSISSELEGDLRAKEICSLCVDIGNGKFKCVYFSIDKLPRDMIEHFILFNDCQPFEFIWNGFSHKLNKASITFTDIYEEVWKPTIASCKDLLHNLCKKSFTFSDIECFVTNVKNIEFHVTTLYNAMYQCDFTFVSSLSNSKQWIPQAVKNIAMYLDFAKYAIQVKSNTVKVTAVEMCLNLKKLLRLKGDFSVVNNLDGQVRVLNIILEFKKRL